MDCLDTFFSARYVSFLMPSPSVQTCSLSLRNLQKLRSIPAATQNVMAPAFGQYSHSQLQEIQREDPYHREAPFQSLTLSSSAGKKQDFAENATLDLDSYFRNPEKIITAHDALQTLILGQNRPRLSEREERLIKTLKERREIVKELLMGSMKAARLRPTFSKGVINSMPEFIDLVMIKAAALKKTPEHVNAPFSYRARLYIEQAAVGKKVRWLKHHRFTFTKIGRLVYMVEDHKANLEPKIKWLKSINVHGRDLGAALTRDPVILEKTVDELKENVQLLKTAGVRSDWIGWVIRRSSRVLACSKEELQERIDFYTRLGITGDNFGKLAYNFPACLGHFSLEEMHSKVDYLRAFGLDDRTLGEVIALKPQLMACSIEESWKPLVKLFYFLGIDGYGLRRILIGRPSVFCLNISNNIAPKIRFLRDVGVQEEAIGDVLVKFPSFLSYSLDEKIRPCVIFLLEKAAVPIDKVGKVLSLQPDLVRCSISKKLEIVVRFFIFHGFRREQVGLMVTEFPMLLRYSLSSLKPKLSFVLRVMKLPVQEIVKFPRLFSHSLESRIIPRYKTLKKKRLTYSLRRMLACSDEEFMKSLDENGTDETEGKNEVQDCSKAGWLDVSAELDVEDVSESVWRKAPDAEEQVFDGDMTSDTSWHSAVGLSEPNWLDMSAQMDTQDMPEFSWHGSSDAEGADEVFDGDDEFFDGGEDISDLRWKSAFSAEDIDEVFGEEKTSDASWHSMSAD